jgi:transposase-like protein
VSRPPKYNEQRAQRVLEAIRAGATRRAAAGHAGVDDATLYRWIERYASFATLLTRVEDDVEVRCTATILQASLEDWRAAAWWLERRRSESYGRRFEPDTLAAAVTTVTVHFDRPETETLALPDV